MIDDMANTIAYRIRTKSGPSERWPWRLGIQYNDLYNIIVEFEP